MTRLDIETEEYLNAGITLFEGMMLAPTEEQHARWLFDMVLPRSGSVIALLGNTIGAMGRYWHGFDPSLNFVAVTAVAAQIGAMTEEAHHPAVRPWVGQIHQSGLIDESVDGVIMGESLGYAPLPDAIAEAWRILKRPGWLLVKDFDAPAADPGVQLASSSWGYRFGPAQEIVDVARQAGFAVRMQGQVQASFERFKAIYAMSPRLQQARPVLDTGGVTRAWIGLFLKLL